MKKILFTFALLFGFNCLWAQDFGWQTNLKKAIEISNNEKKPILMLFTGSDWCVWCKKLQKEIISKPEFLAWAKDKVVLLELDFPKRTVQTEQTKKQNSEILELFEIESFPTVWFVKTINNGGEVSYKRLGFMNYQPNGPMGWIEDADKIIAKYNAN